MKEILRLCPAEKLMSIYKIPKFGNVDEFLMNVANVRGKLKKGGVLDSPAAARIVLHDWNEGMLAGELHLTIYFLLVSFIRLLFARGSPKYRKCIWSTSAAVVLPNLI